MPLAPAFRLGPYEILDLLSVGGMGEIYRARDTRLGRQVAIKVLPEGFGGDSGRLSRFQVEARATGALNHPNIVAIYDVGVQDGIPFVVSELIDGVTLRTTLRGGAVPQAIAIDYTAQMARALAAAHASGVVHRDLKPENVMVLPDGRIKIVDFGIAKLEGPVDRAASDAETGTYTLPGTLLGTIAYMSPEQVRGGTVDHRSDIFSLGVIFYEILAGRHPFGQPTAAETMSAILRDDPAPIDGLDPDLEWIIRHALEKEAGARFQSARDMALALDSLAQARRAAAASPVSLERVAAGDRTIAVLPFANLSADEESEYFSDGLTEELIQALTRVRGVRVVAWHSAAQMKGRERDVRAVGQELGVGTVLSGTVRRAGDRVRIAARLTDVRSGYYLWSETYDRRLEDVFAIQEEIAHAIVATLQTTLAGAQASALIAHPRANVEAYNLYLKGRFFWNKRTADGLRRSVECFERAIAIDEGFALAHAGLADACCLLADYGEAHSGEVMPRARAAALRALDLDPRSAEAHTSFAYIRSLYDWEWLEAEALYRRAIELGPGYATAHHWLAIDLLALLGRFDEAAGEIATACQLDPLSLIIQEGRGYLLMLARRYDEAIEEYRSISELDTSFPRSFTSIGRAFVQKGMYREGIEMLEKGRQLAGDVPNILGALGQAHALAGDAEAARRLLARLHELSTTRHVPSTPFALIHSALGEYDVALDWLEHGCAQHELPVTVISAHPAYDALRERPRFKELLRRMRFAA